MNISKTLRKIISCIVLCNFVCYGVPVYAQEGSAVSGVEGGNSGLSAEVNTLRTKVNQLEKTLAGQAELIAQQKKILEKIAEVVPEVKALMTPPEPKTLVNNFVVNGTQLFTAAELEKVLAKYKGKELGMSDLKKAADEITALYRKKGYLVSLAYVPTQEISNNTVEFNVVEGRVGEITVEKPKYSKAEVIKRRFLVEKGQIVNSNRIEAALKQINKQPDRTIRAVLSPGATPETSNILLKVEKEKSPQHFYTEVNNRGTKYTSLTRWGLGYINNNLLGNDDILSLHFIANGQTEVYSGSAVYDMPISRYNTRAGAYVAYSKADIGGQFAIPGLSPTGHAELWGLYVSHPWLNKEFSDEASGSTLTLISNLTAGFDSLSVHNDIMEGLTSNDELRILKAGINFEEKDNLGRSGLVTEAHFGIPEFLGSMDKYDEDASRIDAGGEFQKYTGSISRVTRLPGSMWLVNSFKGQYTPFALVSGAQMSLGGADSVRGFPENEYLADYGWINTAELRMPPFLLPSILKVPFDKKHTSLTDAVQLVGFIDAGKGYINKARVGEVNEKFLVGAGFGFRLDLYERLRARIDFGFPLGHEKPSDGSNSRIHFGVQYDW
ncbi:MAG: ShlB/FhaC/HecB family hemolysin secretion/activation protein [Candidatus Omnitrophota bacterium]